MPTEVEIAHRIMFTVLTLNAVVSCKAQNAMSLAVIFQSRLNFKSGQIALASSPST
jgi:hypothetical protein